MFHVKHFQYGEIKMTVNQVYTLVNGATSQILGESAIVKEDLSNIVDIGKAIIDNDNVDNYVKTLVDRIGKTIFVDRKYSGRVPSVVMDSWEFGSVLQKISSNLPDATENESWELTDGTSYDPNIFYKPSVEVKFFNSKSTFEIPMSFTTKQIKESFTSAENLNAFLSMLYSSVEKSITVKIDSLVMRTINNMIAQTFSNDSNGVRAVNLLEKYNALGNNLTADKALTDSEFLRFASMQMALTANRMSVMSSIFNSENKPRFTPKDKLHTVLLSDFAEGAKIYLYGDTFHEEFIKFPTAETVPYWQGSGTSFDFGDISSIKVTIKDGSTTKDVEKSGILGVMFDRDSLGVSNLDRRVTTNYNPKAEFYNNWYKFDAGYFNDLSENFVVFYVEDSGE